MTGVDIAKPTLGQVSSKLVVNSDILLATEESLHGVLIALRGDEMVNGAVAQVAEPVCGMVNRIDKTTDEINQTLERIDCLVAELNSIIC